MGYREALPPSVSWPWIATAAIVWTVASTLASIEPEPPMRSPGAFEATGSLLTDPIPGHGGYRAVVDTGSGKFLLEIEEAMGLARGAVVYFVGRLGGDPGRLMTHRYRGRVVVKRLSVVEEAPLLFEIGQRLRDRVLGRVSPMAGGRALLAGFLIGETSGLSREELEAMRRAGLSHFVAVSGSNVALFIGLLFVAAGPLALGPRRRAVVGLLGLPVYAAATRFEPSVMRASLMAGLTLGGRLIGLVFEAWQLLSLAVIFLLAVDPLLASSVGFQLSVAATAGVLVGARWPIRGGRIARSLVITVGAQVAVAPLILLHFGSVPLMSPLINLIAGPLVALSTTVGALGAVGPGFLIEIASGLASIVLLLASGSESWPQLGPGGLMAVFLSAALAARRPTMRPLVVAVCLGVLSLAILGFGRQPPDASVTVLDVGQGDAILLHGGDERYALVDGGPDRLLLIDRLREYGVEQLELVVLSHVHADHATGLIDLAGRVEIEMVWARTKPHRTEASDRLFESMAEYGVPVSEPRVGDTWSLGQLKLVVEAPLRRYASPNDQSIVLVVAGPSRDMLLAGDIETVAQGELGHLQADILKVPHQGAGTSDSSWLRSVDAELAVISVGPNRFGHPADWVIEVLADSGARVSRTDQEGDITIPLG